MALADDLEQRGCGVGGQREVAEKLSTTATLERLLDAEVRATEDRRLSGRLRFASLPAPWTLEDLDYDASPALDRALIEDLASRRFIEQASNVLLVGPPGVGKTHIAIGLARKAAEAGYRTYFTTAADLAARCHRAAIEGRWATTMRFFAGPTLLVVDELGSGGVQDGGELLGGGWELEVGQVRPEALVGRGLRSRRRRGR